jgi:hypothetical protein
VKLPTDMLERNKLCQELVRQCTASRRDRFTFYQTCRNYYLFGSGDARGAPYNKIGSTVDTLSSFIYSPDSTRFSLHLGTEAPVDDIAKSMPLAKEVTEQWRASKTHTLFGVGVRWSNVFGVMIVKTMWMQNRVRTYLVEPHQFGVLREDIMDLSDQEAFTHHYTLTKTQLEASLEGNPRKNSILARVGRATSNDLPAMSTGLSRLIIGSPVGGVPGSIAIPGNMSGTTGGLAGGNAMGPQYDYAPRVEVELVDMCDLYVWSDEQQDYQVITRAAPDVIIYDRPSNWLGHVQGIAPFSVIRPAFNLYDYFWGDSFVAQLTWLQDWRTDRTMQVRMILNKQADPPTSITGGVGISEEKISALRAAGGMVNFPTPNAKVQQHAPTMPSDIFAEMSQIDAMFDDRAGLGHVLQGKGEPGVRSRGQADLMARLGSSRPKERAISVEEAAEDVAGQILRLTQDHSEQRFQCQIIVEGKSENLTFTAEQFTRDYEVKVDAHSSSPIFVEDRKHDAITLLEAHAIDRETLLDLFDPPNLQDLKERLKKMEAQELEAKKMEMQSGQHPPAHKGKHK